MWAPIKETMIMKKCEQNKDLLNVKARSAKVTVSPAGEYDIINNYTEWVMISYIKDNGFIITLDTDHVKELTNNDEQGSISVSRSEEIRTVTVKIDNGFRISELDGIFLCQNIIGKPNYDSSKAMSIGFISSSGSGAKPVNEDDWQNVSDNIWQITYQPPSGTYYVLLSIYDIENQERYFLAEWGEEDTMINTGMKRSSPDLRRKDKSQWQRKI